MEMSTSAVSVATVEMSATAAPFVPRFAILTEEQKTNEEKLEMRVDISDAGP